tara:strand:+ start:3680 stop:4657 length:978 start_codon:yes stop_codon:yes gene_type:complete
MGKSHLISTIVNNLQTMTDQSDKHELLSKYKNEMMLERIVSIAYNPWINLKMQDFETVKSGKKFGMGISKFLHIVDDIVANKLDAKERRFSCNMALQHIDEIEAPLFLSLVRQELDLGLEIETINSVWNNLIMAYPIRTSSFGDITEYKNFPACVQPISRGLRVNVIVDENEVSYRDKTGNVIEGWECWDEQFINLAQGQKTVLDGHAVIVDENNNIAEEGNKEVLEAEGNLIRFTFWDAIRYDGFARGYDDRMGYNWRYNGIQHMMMLAAEKTKKPCYSAIPVSMVGSQEQLENTVKQLNNKCVVKQLDGIWQHGETEQEIIVV